MLVEFSIQCACGLDNTIYLDMKTNRYIVECKCGTKITINAKDWYIMSQAQIAREMKRCDWEEIDNGSK